MRTAGESPLQTGGTWEPQTHLPPSEDWLSKSSEKCFNGEELTGHTWKGDYSLGAPRCLSPSFSD